MVIFITLFFGALGYFVYSSKREFSLIDESLLDESNNDDDFSKELEDLFI